MGKHPDIAYPYNISGLAFFEEGDDSSTLQYSERAREILQATFGEAHPTYTKSDRFRYLATRQHGASSFESGRSSGRYLKFL